MKLPKPSEGKAFELAPAGNHLGVCCQVIDLGTQTTTYEGTEKQARKVMIAWELPEESMEDGRPFIVTKRYTFSVHEKATFRKHLESWRGKKFTEEDFGQDGFDIRNLIGKACFVNVVHNTNGERTYANIESIAQLPKGMTSPKLVNNPLYFTLEPDAFQPTVYLGLPEWLQLVIQESPEFKDADIQDKLAAGGAGDEMPF